MRFTGQPFSCLCPNASCPSRDVSLLYFLLKQWSKRCSLRLWRCHAGYVPYIVHHSIHYSTWHYNSRGLSRLWPWPCWTSGQKALVLLREYFAEFRVWSPTSNALPLFNVILLRKKVYQRLECFKLTEWQLKYFTTMRCVRTMN